MSDLTEKAHEVFAALTDLHDHALLHILEGLNGKTCCREGNGHYRISDSLYWLRIRSADFLFHGPEEFVFEYPESLFPFIKPRTRIELCLEKTDIHPILDSLDFDPADALGAFVAVVKSDHTSFCKKFVTAYAESIGYSPIKLSQLEKSVRGAQRIV